MDIYAGIDPVELTGYARAALDLADADAYPMDAFYPNTEGVAKINFAIKKYNTRNNGEVAPFRAFDTEAGLINDVGFKLISGEIPAISIGKKEDEYTLLKLNGDDDILTANAEKATDHLIRMIRNRLQAAAALLARTGKIAVSDGNFIATFDYERDASLDVVPAGDNWASFATSDPMGDELGWVETYIAKNGFPPGGALMNSKTRAMQLQSLKLRQMMPIGLGTKPRITSAELNQIRTDDELPPITITDRIVDGNKLIPDGEVVYMPPSSDRTGEVLWGTTAESLTVDLDRTEKPGIVAITYEDVNPVALYTYVNAIAIPTAGEVDRTMRATVN